MAARGLAEYEIALIKAMLRHGKDAGFTAERILTYFSRPDRTVNVARVYEIRNGERGADIPPASEAELHLFLARFSVEHPPPTLEEPRRPWTPPPAYIGVSDGRVSILPRFVLADDQRQEFRKNLLQEQARVAQWFLAHWSRLQVDQRLEVHLENYLETASADHTYVNIFTLDDEFRVLSNLLEPETEGLGEVGEAHWENLRRNHVVLTDLYPEMREYRAMLTGTGANVQLAEHEAQEATGILGESSSEELVAPEVPSLIQKHLGVGLEDNPEAARKRAYDVASSLNTVYTYLSELEHALAKAEKIVALKNRIWPPLKVVLKFMGWL